MSKIIAALLGIVGVILLLGFFLPKVFIGDGLKKFSGDNEKVAKYDLEMSPAYFDRPLARLITVGYEIENVTKMGDDLTFCGQTDMLHLPSGKFESYARIYTFFGLTLGRIKIDCNGAIVL